MVDEIQGADQIVLLLDCRLRLVDALLALGEEFRSGHGRCKSGEPRALIARHPHPSTMRAEFILSWPGEQRKHVSAGTGGSSPYDRLVRASREGIERGRDRGEDFEELVHARVFEHSREPRLVLMSHDQAEADVHGRRLPGDLAEHIGDRPGMVCSGTGRQFEDQGTWAAGKLSKGHVAQ